MKRQWVIVRGLAREAEHSREFLNKLQAADPDSEVKGFDLPGAGEYHTLSSPMTIDGIAEFVAMNLRKEKAGERYIIAVSLGAMVITAMLKKYPDLASGAMLVNASFSNLSPFYHRMQLEAFMHIYRAATAPNLHERERAILDMVSNRPDRHDYIDTWAAIARQRPVSAANFAKQLFAAATYSLDGEKPDVPMIVAVSVQDRMVHPECSKRFAEFWKLPLETHPTAGHELWLDDGDWVVEKAMNFFISRG